MKKLNILVLYLFLGSVAPLAVAQNSISVPNDRNGKEETIELPDGMTADIGSLLAEWSAKEYLTPDTTAAMQDVNPYFSDSVYTKRLQLLPTLIEMPYNATVRKFIDHYSGKLRRSVSYMLAAGNFYIPIFEEALDIYGLPLELKYLPVVESGLNPIAVSKSGGVGLWHLPLTTAKRYGLEINSLTDERRCPIKATMAAARYLKDLYDTFGDWHLAIAAFNCGPDNVTKAINRAGGIKDYWTLYTYLPGEARGYVPAFIAANYIMNYYCEHNIAPMITGAPIATDTLIVSQNIHFTQIAEVCKVETEALHALNPQYRTDVVPGSIKPSILRLPTPAVTAFINAGDSIYTYKQSELFNEKRPIVAVEVKEEKKTTTTGTRNSSSPRTVTVRRGQTLSEIARKNRTTVAKIRQLNGLKGNSIRAGQKLRVR